MSTESNLDGFVWSHQNITGLISQSQFANFWQVGLLDVFFFHNTPQNPLNSNFRTLQQRNKTILFLA